MVQLIDWVGGLGGFSAKIVPLNSRSYCVLHTVTMCISIAAVSQWLSVNSCQKEKVAQSPGFHLNAGCKLSQIL